MATLDGRQFSMAVSGRMSAHDEFSRRLDTLAAATETALMRELSRRARTEGSEDFREFVELRGAVIRDLRRFIPGRGKRTAQV